MKDLVWNDILSIGVDEIDDDHRKLVNLFNMLNRAVTEGGARDYRGAVLQELINCTLWHFSHEERLMLKHGYPDIDSHKAVHRELIKSARKLEQKILSEGAQVSAEHIEFLEHWLTEHILTADRKLGTFLAKEM